MKTLNLFLLLFFINLNINAQNCVYLQEECGGPTFSLEGMSLCITYTCYSPNGGVPQASTVCKTIIEGTACGYPSQGINCVLSFRINGLYASVTGSLNGIVTVKRWLAPSILLDGNNLDSRVVFYEPEPADSYYNYSSAPLTVCKDNSNVIDFKGHIMQGNCVNYKLYRSTSTHPGAPTGPLLASINGVTYNPIQNIDALLDGSNIPINTLLILKIESFCCGSAPTNFINKTKYIFLKVVTAPNANFEFMTSSLGDPLVGSPGESNQADNLEFPSTDPNNRIVLSPWACGALFPQYTVDQGITEIKYEIEHAGDCISYTTIYSSGWITRNSSGNLPTQVNFNSLPINGGGGFFGIGYPANIGKCYRFLINVKNGCGITTKIGYFTFSQEVYLLKKKTEKYSEATELFILGENSETHDIEMNLYPNPADQQVFFTNSERISKVNLLSSDLKFHEVSLFEGGIDVSQLNAGLWYCELILKDGSKVYKKLIKK